jgi:hypothetical protein
VKKTLAIDFDGVLHGYSKGWQGGKIYDDPIPGAKAGMQKLMDAGYELVIFSTRNYDRFGVDGDLQANQVNEMTAWLDEHDIPYHRIHTEPGKPLCKLFVDDNAYRFEGDWAKAVKDIETILSKPKAL